MKKLGIIGLVVFVLLFVYVCLMNKNSVAEVDGKKYEYVLYDISQANLTYSRSDQNPPILKTYPWIASASLSYGAAFMTSSSSETLNSYFETPPPDVRNGALKIVGNDKLQGEIIVVSVEKFLVNKEWMLLVGIKRSDFPKALKFSRHVERNGRWVLADGSRDPDGNLVRLLGEISDKAHKNLTAGIGKSYPLSRFQ